jgi:hypothetical protein
MCESAPGRVGFVIGSGIPALRLEGLLVVIVVHQTSFNPENRASIFLLVGHEFFE